MMLPILFPATVMGLSLLIFFSTIGLSGSMYGLVVAHTIVVTPFVIRMVTASLGEFDPAVEEAARNLGAGWWRTFFLITLPLAVVAFGLALVLVPSHVNEGSDPVDNLGGVL